MTPAVDVLIVAAAVVLLGVGVVVGRLIEKTYRALDAAADAFHAEADPAGAALGRAAGKALAGLVVALIAAGRTRLTLPRSESF